MRVWQLHARVDVRGRPATFATAAEGAWKAAVHAAFATQPFESPDRVRFKVVVEFRTKSQRPDERWDIDNLVKPTLDAMGPIFGMRRWKGVPQPQDDRVDVLHASKRDIKSDEQTGATVEVWYSPEEP